MTRPQLRALPVKDHRADFEIHPPTFRTRATCECGWKSEWFHTAARAAMEWRDHAGVDE